MSTVAWYEIFISIIILIGSTVGIGILSAKIYRVGVLLYGTPPKLTKIMKEVFKKQQNRRKNGKLRKRDFTAQFAVEAIFYIFNRKRRFYNRPMRNPDYFIFALYSDGCI